MLCGGWKKSSLMNNLSFNGKITFLASEINFFGIKNSYFGGDFNDQISEDDICKHPVL